MRHLLPALALSLAGVCLPVFPDFAAPATELTMIKEGPADPVADPPTNPDRDQTAPGDIDAGESASSAPIDPPQSADNMGGRPSSSVSREELCTLLASSAEDNALPVAFFVRLIWQESGFDRMSVSSAGAQGVAQFMPEVAQELGVRDPFDPREALPASAQLLRSLHAKFGNLGLAAAAYNAGPKRVFDWLAKRSGLPKETRDYVRIVTGIPAEHWINAKLQRGELQVPRRVPCDQVASASELPSPAPAQKPASSRLRHPAPAVEYMRAASPSLTPPVRLTRLARHDNVTSRDRRGAGIVRAAELKTQAKRGAEDRKGVGVVRTADLRMRAKPGNNDRKGAHVVRVAELKMHAKRGSDKRRAS
jgi:hypothetical protein